MAVTQASSPPPPPTPQLLSFPLPPTVQRPQPHFSFQFPSQFTAPAPCYDTESSSYPRKRARPLADIDGFHGREWCSKKRRLRLTLVTSRLSEPYSSPPTNILERGNCSRVALWAKTRAVAQIVLRKAAILNKIKLEAMAARAAQERQVEIARQQFRERLAAAAQQPAPKRSRVTRHHPPVQQTAYSLRPRKAKGGGVRIATTTRTPPPSPEELRKSEPFTVPKHCRPPSPPSETELELQRRRMGLD